MVYNYNRELSSLAVDFTYKRRGNFNPVTETYDEVISVDLKGIPRSLKTSTKDKMSLYNSQLIITILQNNLVDQNNTPITPNENDIIIIGGKSYLIKYMYSDPANIFYSFGLRTT